jgi:hypothetical protein
MSKILAAKQSSVPATSIQPSGPITESKGAEGDPLAEQPSAKGAMLSGTRHENQSKDDVAQAAELTALPPSPSAARLQKSKKTSSTCPICFESPLHLRFQCPVVIAGPTSIEKRILELKKWGRTDASVIEGLESMLQKAKRQQYKNGLKVNVHRAPK